MTRTQTAQLGFLPKLVIALAVALLAAGAFRYDLTSETLGRMWNDFVNRPGGPMTFQRRGYACAQPRICALALLLHDFLRAGGSTASFAQDEPKAAACSVPCW